MKDSRCDEKKTNPSQTWHSCHSCGSSLQLSTTHAYDSGLLKSESNKGSSYSVSQQVASKFMLKEFGHQELWNHMVNWSFPTTIMESNFRSSRVQFRLNFTVPCQTKQSHLKHPWRGCWESQFCDFKLSSVATLTASSCWVVRRPVAPTQEGPSLKQAKRAVSFTSLLCETPLVSCLCNPPIFKPETTFYWPLLNWNWNSCRFVTRTKTRGGISAYLWKGWSPRGRDCLHPASSSSLQKQICAEHTTRGKDSAAQRFQMTRLLKLSIFPAVFTDSPSLMCGEFSLERPSFWPPAEEGNELLESSFMNASLLAESSFIVNDAGIGKKWLC